mmetsp:Transcript_3393/g.9938  ORF Transcript_3393/g.9938 Transcript_3393/m.9938 type:complete len:432 (-) Transcript_3393:50-1345(-)
MRSHRVGQHLSLEAKHGLLLLKVKRHVVLLLVVDVALGEDGLHHAPVEGALGHVLAPVGPQAVGGGPQVVPRDLGVDVVRDVHADVMAQDLNPAREVAVDGSGELGLGGVPVLGVLERDERRSVVDDREGGHPEVVSEPRHQPKLDKSGHSGVFDDQRPSDGHEGDAGGDADDDTGLLVVRVLVEVKVPEGPVSNRRPELERRAEEGLVDRGHGRGPLGHLGPADRVPGGVLHQLVGVGVVLVVLDPPRVERVDEWHEHEGSHDVLHELVLGEGPVPTVVPNHKEAGPGGRRKGPRQRQQVPGADGDEENAGRHAGERQRDSGPSLDRVDLEDLLGQRFDDVLQRHAVRQLLSDLPVPQALGQGGPVLVRQTPGVDHGEVLQGDGRRGVHAARGSSLHRSETRRAPRARDTARDLDSLNRLHHVYPKLHYE